MNSAQRQALILSRINDLRRQYIELKDYMAVLNKRKQKGRTLKRGLSKTAIINHNKQLLQY